MQFSRLRKLQLVLVTFLLLLMLFLLAGELVFRFVYIYPGPPYNNKVTDNILGWMPQPHYTYTTDNFPDNAGGSYPVNLSFKKSGFRLWPDKEDTTGGTVLFIGDSYTESLECSDDNTFYSIAGKQFFSRVFAYGCSGYGTLQQLMVLQKYIDTIRPQYIVLQMCSNDFADNYWKLEEVTGYKVGQRRPYLLNNDSIEYHTPHYFVTDIKKYSKFLHFLLTKGRNAMIKLKLIDTSTPDDIIIAQKGLAHKAYNHSYLLTAELLKQIKMVADKRGARLVVFMADNLKPGSKHLEDICLANNVAYVKGVADSVYTHQLNGEIVRAFDGYHWNDNGHRIVANQLKLYFDRAIDNR